MFNKATRSQCSLDISTFRVSYKAMTHNPSAGVTAAYVYIQPNPRYLAEKKLSPRQHDLIHASRRIFTLKDGER